MEKLKSIPENPRRDFVKKKARAFLLSSRQESLPIDVDTIFNDNGWLVFTAEEAEQRAGMSIPNDFYNNATVEAISCLYKGQYVIIYKSIGRSKQKIRFTKAHEIGHIALGHLVDYKQPSSFSIGQCTEYRVLEREADMFAAELLAPTPILKDIGLTQMPLIRDVCDISQIAADITISDIHKDLNVSENERIEILRKFHRYTYSHEYLQRIHVATCPTCSTFLTGSPKFCHVCGNKILNSKLSNPYQYRTPLQTQNGRLLYCSNCKNTVFQGGATQCPNCGMPLYNKCTNPKHNKLLPGFARYCPICGSKTTYYSNKLLTDWETDRYNDTIAIESIKKTIKEVPISVDWHFWLHRVLPKTNLMLYISLLNTVATYEYGDLTIYSNERKLPNKYIKESLTKYCNMEIITTTIENGGFTYDY